MNASDIFSFIASIVLIIVAGLLVVVLVYVIILAREVRQIMAMSKEFITHAKAQLRLTGSLSKTFFIMFKRIFSRNRKP